MNKKENSIYICDQCSKRILGAKAYYILQHQRQEPHRKGFCSRQCSAKYNTKERVQLNCKNCNQSILRLPNDVVGEVFCSTNCAAIYNNVKRYVKSDKEIKKAIRDHKSFAKKSNCLNCNLELNGKKAYGTYCSQNCQHEFEYENYIQDWKLDKILGGDERYGRVSSQVRRYIFNKYENKCSKCGWNEINPHSKKSTLQVEHIDGNAYNHKEENLELLCPNCHSLTKTYGGLNVGHGRKNRKNLSWR